MHKIKVLMAVPFFALIAIIILPLVVFDFNAANEEFPLVTLHDSGQLFQHETAALTVGDFFNDINVSTTYLDRVSYPMDSPLYDGMVIQINRAVRFSVVIDGNIPRAFEVRYGTTVSEILTQMQEQYDMPFIYANDLERMIVTHDVLRFSSWSSRYYSEIVEVPYEVIENYTGAVRYGRTHVRQRGESGEHEITVNVVYIGGHEDSRTITDEVILIEPISAIIDIGTAQLGALTNTNAPDFHFVRRVRLHATAYCACFTCTGKHPGDPWHGITASGRMVQHGIVAVDTSVIPMGTFLYVEGYGFAIAADRGGAIVGDRIDLFMYNHSDALRFGRRDLNVWILN